MELTSENVEKVFFSSLYDADDTNHTDAVKVMGVTLSVGFKPERLAEQEAAIVSFIDQLHPNFISEEAGGWSFLNLCMRRDDVLWGQHRQCDMLVTLAMAVGHAYYPLDNRDIWKVMPGGMPYVAFTREKSRNQTQKSLTA